jgi:hypothetical protein
VTCDPLRASACQGGACRCGAAPACTDPVQCSLSPPLQLSAVGFSLQSVQQLKAPPSAFPASTTSWTFATWVRLDVDRDQYTAIFTTETPTGHPTSGVELVTAPDGTTLTIFSYQVGADVTVTTIGALTVGVWYFVAISVGPGGAARAALYDGAGGVTRSSGTVAVLDSIALVYLGASNFAFQEYLNGSMARSRLWNGVLSDAEVAAEYASAVPVRTAGLLGDWRMVSGESVGVDSSGLGHDLGVQAYASHTTVTGPILPGGVALTCH